MCFGVIGIEFDRLLEYLRGVLIFVVFVKFFGLIDESLGVALRFLRIAGGC
jgi:hypothetical protein